MVMAMLRQNRQMIAVIAGERPRRKIRTKKGAAIAALLTSHYEEAASAFVSEQHAFRWLNEPEFRGAYIQARGSVIRQSRECNKRPVRRITISELMTGPQRGRRQSN